jgi:hypothetical protein
MTGISQTTMAKIKAILRIFFNKENDKVSILGGPGVRIEVDETVMCRRRKIKSPTSADDDIKDTV